jgi:hypothetical protein
VQAEFDALRRWGQTQHGAAPNAPEGDRAPLERLLPDNPTLNDFARAIQQFPMFEALLLELWRVRLDAQTYRQLFEAAARRIPENARADAQRDHEKILLERDRQRVKGTGKTTARILAGDFGLTKQAVTARLRKLNEKGKISTSHAQNLTPEEVKIARAALSAKVGSARGKARPRK